ncbi:MAG: hypothetical protein RhofKO_33890 [Rhodothermales bacterium]
MPYDTHWDEHGITWTAYGDLTAQEIEDANSEFYGHARCTEARYQIINALRIESMEWSDLDIKKTAAHDVGAHHYIRHLKVAYIANHPEIIEKLEKYIAIARRSNATWLFRGFSTLEDARAWVRS